jgi:hypothetical protein
MNMEIGTEAAQFPEKEHITGIFVAVCTRGSGPRKSPAFSLKLFSNFDNPVIVRPFPFCLKILFFLS